MPAVGCEREANDAVAMFEAINLLTAAYAPDLNQSCLVACDKKTAPW